VDAGHAILVPDLDSTLTLLRRIGACVDASHLGRGGQTCLNARRYDPLIKDFEADLPSIQTPSILFQDVHLSSLPLIRSFRLLACH
jgi:hypothetical protein